MAFSNIRDAIRDLTGALPVDFEGSLPSYQNTQRFTTDFSGDYEDVLQRYSTTALEQAEDVANLGYTQYGGERVAGFSPTELAGRERAVELAEMGLGMPQAQQAADVAGSVAQFQAGRISPELFRETNIQQYAPSFGRVDPAMMRDVNIGEYMSPYQQGVTDIALREMQRQRDIEEQGLAAQAERAGAFGGSRQAILEAELGRNYGQRAADLITQQQQAAFLNAQQQAAADLQRANQAQLQNIELGAQEFGIGADLAGRDIAAMTNAQVRNEALRQAAAQQQLSGASALSGAANQMRQLGFADADVLRTLGAEERGLQQSQMEADYADFLRSQAFPYQALEARLAPLGISADIATAVPTQSRPSSFQSLLGTLGTIGSTAELIGGGLSALPDALNPFS